MREKNHIHFWLSGRCAPPSSLALRAPSLTSGDLACSRPALLWHGSVACHQALVEPSSLARNDYEKPHLGFRGFGAIVKLRPWPGLLCRHAHSRPCSLHPAWLCCLPPGVVGPPGEVPACRPLPQPRHSQTPLLPSSSALLPEPKASNGPHAAVSTTHRAGISTILQNPRTCDSRMVARQ